ncbi:ral guanine nucleotide dissociation stimulator-like 1 [Dipodomys merriami]|uniref:ral guanine nucleotide dissociation stimulator-like 1 n=1 Tax=Dipodomys merriami TaxID=94247 RepID=UPI00384A9EF2
MESFGQTDTLADYREDVITQHQICYAISGLLSIWLDCHPEVFLEPTHHPCLQGFLAHLRLRMHGSDVELHVSHRRAQLGIQDFKQDEALA